MIKHYNTQTKITLVHDKIHKNNYMQIQKQNITDKGFGWDKVGHY